VFQAYRKTVNIIIITEAFNRNKKGRNHTGVSKYDIVFEVDF